MAIRKHRMQQATYTTTYECYKRDTSQDKKACVDICTEWIEMEQHVKTSYQESELVAQFQVHIKLKKAIKNSILHMDNKVSSNVSVIEDSLIVDGAEYLGNVRGLMIEIGDEKSLLDIEYSFVVKVKNNEYLHQSLAIQNKVFVYVPTMEIVGLHMTTCLIKVVVPIVHKCITLNVSYRLPACFSRMKHILSQTLIIVGIEHEIECQYRIDYIIVIKYSGEDNQICFFHKKETQQIELNQGMGIRQVIGQILSEPMVVDQSIIRTTLRFIIR